VKSKLAPYKYPRWVEFVDDLPKTVTGKIQRFRLRNRNWPASARIDLDLVDPAASTSGSPL